MKMTKPIKSTFLGDFIFIAEQILFSSKEFLKIDQVF